MNKVIKTVLIVIAVVVSIYLLCIFILYNFPYGALIGRINSDLRKSYGISLRVDDVRYKYPFRIIMRNVEIAHRKGNFTLATDTVSVRMRLMNFRKYKIVEINGSDIAVRNNFIDATGGFLQVKSNINLIRIIRADDGNQIQSIHLYAGGMDVGRVSYSGFEFSSLKLQQVVVELSGGENGFSVERGMLKADVVQSELTGSLDYNGLDVIVSVSLTQTFYDRFRDLKGLVDSFFKNGKLRMHIHGDWQSPQVELMKK